MQSALLHCKYGVESRDEGFGTVHVPRSISSDDPKHPLTTRQSEVGHRAD
jgi:hypothetical protein